MALAVLLLPLGLPPVLQPLMPLVLPLLHLLQLLPLPPLVLPPPHRKLSYPFLHNSFSSFFQTP